MDIHEVDTKGKLWVERLNTLPAFQSTDKGRIVYTNDDDTFYKGAAAEWQEMARKLDVFAGMAPKPTKFSWSTISTIALKSARYHHNGTAEQIIKWDVDLTFTFGPAGSNAGSSALGTSQWQYINIDDSALSGDTITAARLINSTTIPVYQDSKLAYYNGNDRCIGAFWINSSGEIEKFYHEGDLIHWDNQYQAYGTNMGKSGGAYPGTAFGTQVTMRVPGFTEKALATFAVNPGSSVGNYQAFWRQGSSTGTGHSVGIGRNTGSGDNAETLTSNQINVFVDSADQIDIKVDLSSSNAIMAVAQNGYYLPPGIA